MAETYDLTELIRTNNTTALEAELVTNPARAAERTVDGISLLQYAAYCRNEAAGADPNVVMDDGKTPFDMYTK